MQSLIEADANIAYPEGGPGQAGAPTQAPPQEAGRCQAHAILDDGTGVQCSQAQGHVTVVPFHVARVGNANFNWRVTDKEQELGFAKGGPDLGFDV